MEPSDNEKELLQAIQGHYSDEYKKLWAKEVEIHSIWRKQMGGREWLCYSISKIASECALRVDARHYISWSLAEVNNTALKIDARDQLRSGIEESLEIGF